MDHSLQQQKKVWHCSQLHFALVSDFCWPYDSRSQTFELRSACDHHWIMQRKSWLSFPKQVGLSGKGGCTLWWINLRFHCWIEAEHNWVCRLLRAKLRTPFGQQHQSRAPREKSAECRKGHQRLWRVCENGAHWFPGPRGREGGQIKLR